MKINQYIDHTCLKSSATEKEIKKLCEEAIKYNFFTVCINPSYIKLAKKYLENSNVKICTVIGFPLGSNTTKIKTYEAKNAIEEGADEVDMVINVSWLKDKKYNLIIQEINAIKSNMPNHVLKVIVETALLNPEEIKKISEIILESNADYIKTSTGFSTRGANFQDIKIMKEIIKDKKGIKAAGGVSTYEDAIKMINLGATRIGTSRGTELIK